jgi:hypothetical protein
LYLRGLDACERRIKLDAPGDGGFDLGKVSANLDGRNI